MVKGVSGGGCVWWGACMAKHAWQGDACVAGGHVWQGACMAGEMATAVDCTHPTGMYSCLLLAIIEKYGIQLANELDNNLLEEVLILHFDTLQEEHSLLTDP